MTAVRATRHGTVNFELETRKLQTMTGPAHMTVDTCGKKFLPHLYTTFVTLHVIWRPFSHFIWRSHLLCRAWMLYGHRCQLCRK